MRRTIFTAHAYSLPALLGMAETGMESRRDLERDGNGDEMKRQRKDARLIAAGGKMANFCYNLGSSTSYELTPDRRQQMIDMQREWDKELSEYRNPRPKPETK